MPEEEKEPFDFEALSKRLKSSLSGSSDDPLADGEIKDITNGQVIERIRTSKTSIVTFYRDDCPYCEHLIPLLEELAEDFKSKVSFAKVNVDKFENLREDFDVFGVPLVIAFKKGMPVGRVEGLRSIDEYEIWIESIQEGLQPMGIDDGPTTRIN